MAGYIDKIKERARADVKTIVMPETNDKRTLIAAAHVIEEGIAGCQLDGLRQRLQEVGCTQRNVKGVLLSFAEGTQPDRHRRR